MIVACPSCATRYDIDATRLTAGRARLRCARCKTLFPVEAALDPPAARPPSRPGERRLDVALVAAEPGEQRDALVASLASASVRTITAEDGPGALEAARRSRPRLVVLDFYLPGLLGPEVAAAIRQEPALATTRLVLVGGPPARGRHAASPAAVHEVDAHVPDDAPPDDVAAILTTLLGIGGARLPEPPPAEIARLARVAASDLGAYHADVAARWRDAGSQDPRVATFLDAACAAFTQRVPGSRLSPASVEAFRASLERAALS